MLVKTLKSLHVVFTKRLIKGLHLLTQLGVGVFHGNLIERMRLL